MTPRFNEVIIFTRNKDEFYAEVIKYLKLHNLKVTPYVKGMKLPRSKKLFSLVLGGDGWVLSAARDEAPNPVLVINTGHLGFLTSSTKDQYRAAISDLLMGIHTTTSRKMLAVGIEGKTYSALNDVVIRPTTEEYFTPKLLAFGLYVRNSDSTEELISEYRADGVIISTPTGSTAYSLSASGPIIHPTCLTLVVTPICPQGLMQRPLVLPATMTLLVKQRDHDMYASFDGQYSIPIKGDVSVHMNSRQVQLVNPPFSYFEVLRRKLKWGVNPV